MTSSSPTLAGPSAGFPSAAWKKPARPAASTGFWRRTRRIPSPSKRIQPIESRGSSPPSSGTALSVCIPPAIGERSLPGPSHPLGKRPEIRACTTQSATPARGTPTPSRDSRDRSRTCSSPWEPETRDVRGRRSARPRRLEPCERRAKDRDCMRSSIWSATKMSPSGAIETSRGKPGGTAAAWRPSVYPPPAMERICPLDGAADRGSCRTGRKGRSSVENAATRAATTGRQHAGGHRERVRLGGREFLFAASPTRYVPHICAIARRHKGA